MPSARTSESTAPTVGGHWASSPEASALLAGRIGAGSPAIQAVYPLDPGLTRSADRFLPHVAVQLLYFGAWEVLFRGVLLFGLRRRLGSLPANLLQTALSVTAHFGRPLDETLAAIPAVRLGRPPGRLSLVRGPDPLDGRCQPRLRPLDRDLMTVAHRGLGSLTAPDFHEAAMSNHPTTAAATLLGLLLLPGCSDDSASPGPFGPGASMSAMPPASLVSISAGEAQLSIWPYTGNDFSGTPQDPINLVFTGRADSRSLRSALFALDGDRTGYGFPNVFPFNCTWSDAIGDLQTGYNEASRWVGSAVQLQCGIYQPVRFHVRLFNAGAVTLGNAHFEVLIPGTTDHQVLSWELAERLVTVDLVRSGLLGGAPGSTGIINAAPAFREIPEVIYNGLPEDLKAAFGGPPGRVSAPVGIATNGAATVFNLAGEATPVRGSFTQDFVLQFGQLIPRPFCASGSNDLVRVDGPVSLRKQVTLTPAGDLVSEFQADGRLRLQRVDPANGFAPVGPAYEAEVKDQQTSRYGDSGGQITGLQIQTELPQSVEGRGRRTIRLKVGPGDVTQYDLDVSCNH